MFVIVSSTVFTFMLFLLVYAEVLLFHGLKGATKKCNNSLSLFNNLGDRRRENGRAFGVEEQR